MVLFSLLMKKGLENTKKYVDVTDYISTVASYKLSGNIFIDTEMEIHILRSKDKTSYFRFFSIGRINPESIKVNVDCNADKTHIVIESKKSLKDCYVEMFVPSIVELKVFSKNADIRVENCNVKNASVQTSNGEITVITTDFSVMDLTTVAGDINVVVVKKPLCYELHSKYGDKIVESVKYNPDASRMLRCCSDSGDLLLKYVD